MICARNVKTSNLKYEYLGLASQRRAGLNWRNQIVDGDCLVHAVQLAIVAVSQHRHCKAVAIPVILFRCYNK